MVKGVTVRLRECLCILFRFLKFCVPLSHSKSAHPAKLTVQSQNRLSFKMGLFTTSLVAIEILLAFSTSGQDSGFDNNEMQCLKTLPPREGSLIGQVRNMVIKSFGKTRKLFSFSGLGWLVLVMLKMDNGLTSALGLF